MTKKEFWHLYPGVRMPDYFFIVGLICWRYKYSTGILKILPTINNWYQTLPEPYRSQALANMWWEDAGKIEPSLKNALLQGFNWSRSPQKTKYWKDFYEALH